MSTVRLRCAIILILGTSVAGIALAEDFRVYSNPRFGATAKVPRSWKADPSPDNGDGLVFRSQDGAASITVSGILNNDETPAVAMRTEAKPQQGETITYRQTGRRTVTVSGTKGDMIFYRKSLLVCRDQIWNHVSIEYPTARKAEYDKLVARVAGSLRFGRSEQITDCR